MKETEFKITVLPEADENCMLKEQYRENGKYSEERQVHRECNLIDEKLKEIKEFMDYRCKCNGGYKNRKR